ncbi:unnamed protein product [Nippostrongylus brasiliensis]|uniref:F-box domain-containing protein n=1 Tax=Nippostrongylus brasiliensis TaxID=27835 RepID=A0A0N4YCS6_NIPBR|nr:unnamed protein product [Nippostrongylus brasiliensis]
MDTLTAPNFSPFQISEEEDRTQISPLLNLPNNVLDSIVSYIPLKVRALMVAPVCRALRDSVNRTIVSVAFYKTQLDELSDTRIKYFLSIYGSKIFAINFDLFRSVEDEIFRECPQLQTLCIDAQYLSGHCFQAVPLGLTRLELEMCLRMTDASMRYIFTRLKKLKVLYVSELKILKDQLISGLVSNLKNLRDLSIIGNPDAPNLDLSASALSHLARLPRLQNLCLEGIPAVTDRFLSEISDTSTNAAARSITSLSLAFCFNVSSMGLQRLAKMPKLDSLNLDGITKRDISAGLEKVAEEGRLMRLLLAEGTNVSCEKLSEIVRKSNRLRLLDISNNDVLADWAAANNLVTQWIASGRPSLTILTNKHLPWSMIRMPPTSPLTPPPVSVIHLHRTTIDDSDIVPGSVLSEEQSFQLPHGLLLPRLRRGNRYRLLCSLRSMSQEDSDDQKENSCSPSHRNPQTKKSQRSPVSVPPTMRPLQPMPLFGAQSPSPVLPSVPVTPMYDIAGYFPTPMETPHSMMLPDLNTLPTYPPPDLSQLVPPDLSSRNAKRDVAITSNTVVVLLCEVDLSLVLFLKELTKELVFCRCISFALMFKLLELQF